MKARILGWAGALRESYWFVPTLMAVSATLMAFAMVYVDSHFGAAWMDDLPWLYAARPDGARGLLSAVGGSMIGVAGTTFSVTIAAVVYASGQYGPRLLSNFMGDRGNQVTLGTFIATFLYTIIVLRTIRSPGEDGSGIGAFVPQLALLVALLLVLTSIAVLIYFIHHVPQQIHINSVIEQIGGRLLREISVRFPSCVGQPADGHGDLLPDALRTNGANTAEIAARGVGYIRIVDHDSLLEIARRRDMVVRLLCQPGDFVHPGIALASALPAARLDDDARADIVRAIGLGSRRTPMQDLRFLLDELVEIAARALSPGVNDPFTASSCLDWLAAAFAELVRRDAPSPLRLDDDGALRLVAYPQRFADLVDQGFGALAQYASTDRITAERFLLSLGSVMDACTSPDRLRCLRDQVAAFRDLAKEELKGAPRDSVMACADAVLSRSGAGPDSPPAPTGSTRPARRF